MSPSENDSIEAAIRGKLEYDRSTSERIKTADTIARLVYLLLGVVIAAAIGVANVWHRIANAEEKLSDHDRTFIERKGELDSLRAEDRKSETQRSELRRDVDRFLKMEDDLRNILFLRDNGITFPQYYQRKFGHSAPGDPLIPAPTPR